MLQTCLCATLTQSDRCWSIKVSIILCVLSADSYLPFLLPQWRTGIFYVTLNKILLSSAPIRPATHMPYAHTFAVIFRLTPHRTHHSGQFGAVRICGCLSVFLVLQLCYNCLRRESFYKGLKIKWANFLNKGEKYVGLSFLSKIKILHDFLRVIKFCFLPKKC